MIGPCTLKILTRPIHARKTHAILNAAKDLNQHNLRSFAVFGAQDDGITL